MIPPGDVADLQAAFLANPRDLGVGLYNPATGEIRLGSFDRVTQGKGHRGLADSLGITDDSQWRGFSIDATGGFQPRSHFNLIDGSTTMRPVHEAAVRQELQATGLIT